MTRRLGRTPTAAPGWWVCSAEVRLQLAERIAARVVPVDQRLLEWCQPRIGHVKAAQTVTVGGSVRVRLSEISVERPSISRSSRSQARPRDNNVSRSRSCQLLDAGHRAPPSRHGRGPLAFQLVPLFCDRKSWDAAVSCDLLQVPYLAELSHHAPVSADFSLPLTTPSTGRAVSPRGCAGSAYGVAAGGRGGRAVRRGSCAGTPLRAGRRCRSVRRRWV